MVSSSNSSVRNLPTQMIDITGWILINTDSSSSSSWHAIYTVCAVAALLIAAFVIWYIFSSSSDVNVHQGALKEESEVYTDFTIIVIRADENCLFRCIVHGMEIARRKLVPAKEKEKFLVDELRRLVVLELIKRRKEVEEKGLIEGADFDSYVAKMSKPTGWGCIAELRMAVHVVMLPIKVFVRDNGGVKLFSQHGRDEYKNHKPINLLYDNDNQHYDILVIFDEMKEH